VRDVSDAGADIQLSTIARGSMRDFVAVYSVTSLALFVLIFLMI
jgi:hypothetical protein